MIQLQKAPKQTSILQLWQHLIKNSSKTGILTKNSCLLVTNRQHFLVLLSLWWPGKYVGMIQLQKVPKITSYLVAMSALVPKQLF